MVLLDGIPNRNHPPLLPHTLRLYRAHEPLLVAGGGDGRCEAQRQSPVQRDQHCAAAAGDVLLQLLFSSRLPRWARRTAAASLPRRLCFVEIREGVGIGEQAAADRPRLAFVILRAVAASQTRSSRGVEGSLPF